MDFIDHRSTANFIFSLSATDEKFRITSDGDVGIGTSSPSTKLEVDGVITTAGLTTTANINFGDNDKAVFGAGSDLQIYHDGSDSYVKDAGTGDLYLQGSNNVQIESAAGANMIYATAGAQVRLFYNGSPKFNTTSTGIDVTGTATADAFEVDDTDDIRLRFLNASTFKAGLQVATTAGDMIATSAVDDLAIRSQSDILFATGGNTERMKIVDTGIDVTGTVTADDLDVQQAGFTSVLVGSTNASGAMLILDGDSNGDGSGGDYSYVYHNTDGQLELLQNSPSGTDEMLFKTAGNNLRMKIGSGGDISFYEDTGTTAKLFWDASAESLGIGTSSPSNTIHVERNVSGDWLGRFRNTNTTNGYGLLVYAGDDSSVQSFKVANHAGSGDYFVVRGDGNVGIGTSSPDRLIHASGGSGSTIAGKFETASTSGSVIVFKDADTTTNDLQVRIGSDANDLVQYAGGSERLRIDSSGRVGIGTSSPSSVLTAISGASADETVLTIANDYSTADTAGDASGLMFQLYRSYASSLNDAAFIKAEKEQAWDSSGDRDSALTFGTRSGGTEPTERMRIDSSGNLLVGTTDSAPAVSNSEVGVALSGSYGYVAASRSAGASGFFNRLSDDGDIVNFNKDGTTIGSIGVSSFDLTIQSSASGHNGLRFGDAWIAPIATNQALDDGTTDLGLSGARFKDLYLSGTAYTNALGVGTTSPDVKVDIVDTAADVQLRVYKFDGTNNTRLALTADDSGAKIHYRDATNGGALRFNNNAGEMARFDSSGNLLVGTTTTTAGNEGMVYFNGSSLRVTRDSDEPLNLDRLTNDGVIAAFKKDGTTVGHIGTGNSSRFHIGSGDVGLMFAPTEDTIYPWDSGSNAQRDAAIDLGYSSHRFKDLYLSGGVYLGGTGSANHLDDYEEGTFTPTVAGDSTGAFSTAEGTYTKVGRLVFIEMYVVVSTNFTSNYIGGLPFTVGNLLAGTSLGQSAVVLTNAADTVTGSAVETSANIRFFNDHTTSSFHNPNTTNGGYRLALCYQV